jgi:4-hydroxy-tetrahydrodipicolinate reductase
MNESTRLVVTGATGRMGEAILALASERADCTVVGAINRGPSVENREGIAIEPATDLPTVLAERDPDVLVDFTGPESAIEYAKACVSAGVAFLTGTTGFDEGELAALEDASETVALLHAANFSPGIAALSSAVDQAVSTLPDYDIELTETHHDRKRDAPSGTATALLDRIETTRSESSGTDPAERVYGREGIEPRKSGSIGVHVRRAGDIRGEHEVLLAGNDEVLTLGHRAESRAVFAAGALDAATWLAGRTAGQYAFTEVLG